jgi:hypothetical protein
MTLCNRFASASVAPGSALLYEAWGLDNGEVGTHVVDGIGGVHWSCLAERVDVGATHSTIQDTPIGTTPVDAIALGDT